MAGELQLRIALEGNLAGFAEQTHLRIARGARIAAERLAARAKLALRQDVRQAGLGDRLANTWRVDIYPKSASAKTHQPAVYIRSKAPKLILAHGADTIIRARNATWLAIPTDNVPSRGRRPMTPEQVEAHFDQDLIFVRGLGRRMMAFVDKRLRGRLKRWRKRGTGAAPQAGRDRLTLMFVMLPVVHLRQRLRWQAIFKELESDWATIFPQEIARALAAGSN